MQPIFAGSSSVLRIHTISNITVDHRNSVIYQNAGSLLLVTASNYSAMLTSYNGNLMALTDNGRAVLHTCAPMNRYPEAVYAFAQAWKLQPKGA